MAKKKYYAILEAVTTDENMVADIAIIICDKEGSIFNQMAVVIKEHYDDFRLQNDLIPGYRSVYEDMLNSGKRTLAGVVTVNHWIRQAFVKYNPELVSWNLLMHLESCAKTGIKLDLFDVKLCLCEVAQNILLNSKKYFKASNLEASTSGSRFSGNCSSLDLKTAIGFFGEKESKVDCTALEKARDAVIPVLCSLIKNRRWQEVALHADGKLQSSNEKNGN